MLLIFQVELSLIVRTPLHKISIFFFWFFSKETMLHLCCFFKFYSVKCVPHSQLSVMLKEMI